MGQRRAGINSELQPSHKLKGLSFETEEYCTAQGCTILSTIPNTWRVSKVFWIEVFSRYFGYFQGIFIVFWVFSRYLQGIYKVFSSMRVGTRLCQRLAVAQSTLTSLIEQRPATFRAPHRPPRPRQPRSRYMPLAEYRVPPLLSGPPTLIDILPQVLRYL